MFVVSDSSYFRSALGSWLQVAPLTRVSDTLRTNYIFLRDSANSITHVLAWNYNSCSFLRRKFLNMGNRYKKNITVKSKLKIVML
jgi:prophage DNA circulation protein